MKCFVRGTLIAFLQLDVQEMLICLQLSENIIRHYLLKSHFRKLNLFPIEDTKFNVYSKNHKFIYIVLTTLDLYSLSALNLTRKYKIN